MPTIEDIEREFYRRVDAGEITLSEKGKAERILTAQWRELLAATPEQQADFLLLTGDMRAAFLRAAAVTQDGPERSWLWERVIRDADPGLGRDLLSALYNRYRSAPACFRGTNT